MSKVWKYKGYILHVLAVAAVFLTPSIKELASSHQAYSAAIVTAWGSVLHWANGK